MDTQIGTRPQIEALEIHQAYILASLNWLEREFYKSNHTKYHRYFKEWITNICPHQVEGFRNQMIGQLTKSKVK